VLGASQAQNVQVERNDFLDLHNSHITVLLLMGPIALTLWLWIFIKWCLTLVRFLKRAQNPELRLYGLWILLSVVAILVASSFAPLLEIPYVAIPFWLLIGVGMALRRLDQPSSKAASPEPQRSPPPGTLIQPV
jgi:hypothetical protein